MKAMMSGCLAVACSVMLAACAVDSPPDQNASPNTNEASGNTPAPEDVGTVYQVPPELSASQLQDLEISGNDATTNACHVTLQFCRDPRNGLPSFTETGCGFDQALNAARSLCRQICGNINCNVLSCFGTNCP
jgi:hypothetical protein